MRNQRRAGKMLFTFGVAAAALTVSLLAPNAASADLSDVPEPNGDDSQRISQNYSVKAETSDGEASTQEICVAIKRVDYPHISTSTPSAPRAVQAHGNWDRGTCAANLADVTTQIDRKNPIGLFQAVGTQGTARLAPNPSGLTSGGAGRVTARYECNGSAGAPFRAWTSIDMVGIADFQDKLYSPATSDIACG